MTAAFRRMLIAALVVSSGAAISQTIYRCGQTCSRVPCPNAKAIEVEGRPTAAQRAEARQIAQREKRLAEKMARDRRVAEAAQQPAPDASLGPAHVAAAPAPAKAPVRKAGKTKRKAAQPGDGRDDFVATVPRVRKTPG